MSSILKVDTIKDETGANTLVTQSGSNFVWGAGAPSGTIIKTTTVTYAPNAIKNLYTGTDTDQLYYNSDFDQTISLTSGNKLIVHLSGGRLTLGTAGADGFAFHIQIYGADYNCGAGFLNDMPLNIFAVSNTIASNSAIIKFGGINRYDSRTPTLDLRNSAAGGNAISGGPLRYIVQEIQA